MEQQGKGLTFSIYPDGESVPVGLFIKAIENVHRLVIDVDYAVTKERVGRRWIIYKLQSTTPTITLRPMLGDIATIEAILNGLRVVTTSAPLEPPAYFTEDALDDLRQMRRLFSGKERANRLVFKANGEKPITIERNIGEKVTKILTAGFWGLGSVEGDLEAINLHGKPTFTIWDRISVAPVRCSFTKEPPWTERVKSLLEKRVLVVGQVNYFRNGIPRSITKIQEIRDMTPDSSLLKATFGSIPSEEARNDPVRFARIIRTRKE